VKVGDENDLLPCCVRRAKDLGRHPEAGAVPCGLAARLKRGDRRVESRRGGRRFDELGRGGPEGDERNPIDRAKPAGGGARGIRRSAPAAAVPHAVRAVEKDDELPAVRAGSRGGELPLEEWPSERRDDDRDRDAAQDEQKDVTDLLPPHRAVRDLAQEHERRKRQRLPTLPVDHVDHHGNRDGHEPREKRRREEAHQPTFRDRSKRRRAPRNAKSARSIGSLVSNCA
jgi:hypothetical protein